MPRPLIAAVVLLAVTVPARAQKSLDIEQREASIRYINDLQGTDGGFRPGPDDRVSQLGATNSALRALKYLGGRPRNRDAVVQFVQSCFDAETGGFAETPGGKPDVRSTAMGVMAHVELAMPLGDRQQRVVSYFVKHARSLPDMYIAAASLHPAGIVPPTAADWIAAFAATRHADGTYGKTIADTGGAVVTTLRLGGSVADKPGVTQILKAAQRLDGGFATAERSDLPTTYRVMRALYMLREKPDLTRCGEFVARCRNEDGGYGGSPGQPSSVSTTYFAMIILHWIDELSAP
jgi:hypothetical protein